MAAVAQLFAQHFSKIVTAGKEHDGAMKPGGALVRARDDLEAM